MKASGSLLLSLLGWFLAMPVIFVIAGAMDPLKFPLITNNTPSIIASFLGVQALWIYRIYVPKVPEVRRRIVHVAVFVAGMTLLGMAAMWVSYWIMLAIHGA